MKRAAVVLLTLLACSVAAQSPAPSLGSIRQDALKADLFFFASDALKGRLTNSPENRIASEFVKSRFERLGLSPVLPGYFQNYNLVTATLSDGNGLAVLAGGGNPTPAPWGQGWYPQRFSASGHVRAPVVFAGFGITAPDIGYDDYGNTAAIRGRIVLVVDGEPGARDPTSPFDGVVTSELSASIHKAQAAQAKGALGILFVAKPAVAAAGSAASAAPASGAAAAGPGRGGTNPFEASARAFWPTQPPRLERYTIAAWMNSVVIPAAQISPELAEKLIGSTGKTLLDLATSAETTKGITPVPLPGIEIDLTTAVQRHNVPDRNVLAKIDGADPRLRDEWVIVSGHMDHDGVAANGTDILNGADDDGSGAIGVLAIAEAYADAAKAGKKPRRSVLFAEFNSEERGLLGAWAFAEQPTMALDKVVAVLNMDMIGRNEEVPATGGNRFNGLDPQTAESNANAMNVIGSVRAPDLKLAVDRANKTTPLDIRYRYDNNTSQLMRRSDHWPFIQHGVPAVWFFTGLHPDYHQTGDKPDKINYPKMERILKLVYQLSWDLANSDARPKLLPRTSPK